MAESWAQRKHYRGDCCARPRQNITAPRTLTCRQFPILGSKLWIDERFERPRTHFRLALTYAVSHLNARRRNMANHLRQPLGSPRNTSLINCLATIWLGDRRYATNSPVACAVWTLSLRTFRLSTFNRAKKIFVRHSTFGSFWSWNLLSGNRWETWVQSPGS